MTTEEAARVLKKMYDDGMRTEKGWASIVLFCIRYADDLSSLSFREVLKEAGISTNYDNCSSLGKLAEYEAPPSRTQAGRVCHRSEGLPIGHSQECRDGALSTVPEAVAPVNLSDPKPRSTLGRLIEGQVGGDQDGAPLVALAEDLEEEVSPGVGNGPEAQLIDDK